MQVTDHSPHIDKHRVEGEGNSYKVANVDIRRPVIANHQGAKGENVAQEWGDKVVLIPISNLLRRNWLRICGQYLVEQILALFVTSQESEGRYIRNSIDLENYCETYQ